jgi:hypothetical protein
MHGYARDMLQYGHELVRFYQARRNETEAEKLLANLLAFEYQLVRRLFRDDATAHHAAAINHLNCPYPKHRNPNRSQSLAQHAVKLAPKNPDYRDTLARAHLRMWDLKGAIHEWATGGLLRLGFDAEWTSVLAARPANSR